MGGVARGVAVSVFVVVGGAMRGELFAARGLRELPDGGVGDATRRRRWRVLREGATRGGWAEIVVGPNRDVACCGVVVNVVGSGDSGMRIFLNRHGGAIDAGVKI